LKYYKQSIFFFLILLGLPIWLPAQMMNTVAGIAYYGWSGDGGPATSAGLWHPNGIAADNKGNFYIADSDDNRIRKVSKDGIITTVAGNGSQGHGGDGGVAISAELNGPKGIAVDEVGDIYIADVFNCCIRKVDVNGIITTVAGNGINGFYGDGGLATQAELSFPEGVAVDVWGNIYIADYYNNLIRKVDTHGIISTLAGNPNGGNSGDGGPATYASLDFPHGVAVDYAGNVYIADQNNNRIRKVNALGIISTVAGNGSSGFSGDGGPAVYAQLNMPEGMIIDGAGNIYIADTYNFRIRMVNTSGIITTIAGNGTEGYNGDGGNATMEEFGLPIGIALDANRNVYVADLPNNRIRLISGISQPSEPILVNVFPNPSNGLVITSLGGSGYSNITLYNMLGKEIYTLALETNLLDQYIYFDSSNFSAGMYVMKIRTEHDEIKKRLEIIR